MLAPLVLVVLASGAPTPESSGTSWQPRNVGMEGWHFHPGPWMLMLHGFVNAAYISQEGPRGDDGSFQTDMLMFGAERPLGPGRLHLRAMASLEPTLGPRGYPLLLQTGETADGRNHLVDRQHPHDVAMELSARYSLPVTSGSAIFLYVGLPGEPALGPPAFMHRPSNGGNPLAPLAHHWMDSTHLTYGVVTAGVTTRHFKVDASAFRGREPDQDRWNIESPRLDSYSGRVTWNPTDAWSVQASAARLESPEALHPAIDVTRATASVAYSPRPGRVRVDALLAWGMNHKSQLLVDPVFPEYNPKRTTHAVLLEGALARGPLTGFLRAQWVEKDELFPRADAFSARVFPVLRVELGAARDLLVSGHFAFGLGGSVSLSTVPEYLEPDYGKTPWGFLVFGRMVVR